MTPLRKTLAAAALSAALTAAGFLGVGSLPSVQLARAQEQTSPAQRQQQVQTTPQQMAAVEDLSSAFRNVGTVVEPSVVNIRVVKTIKGVHRGLPDDMLRRFFPDRNGDGEPDLPEGLPNPGDQGDQGNGDSGDDTLREVGTGSGVIIEASDGAAWIVTNNHVASDASKMEITLSDGRVLKDAQVVGTDPKSDLAVIKVQASNLTPAKWGDSGQLKQGDWVIAFGSPFGYVGSMTHGIISALHRHAGILGQYGYENFIQVDAPINPGNSGGPLANLHGEVIGINTAIASRSGGFQGIGFAIPSNQARQIYQVLKDKGKVVRGWLGVEIADVTKFRDEARATGYQGDAGALVKGVMRDTPAAGKLQAGDVIVGLNGQNLKDSQDLRNGIALTSPGTEITLQVVRDGKQQNVPVKLGEQPGGPPAVARGGGPGTPGQGATALGMRLTDVTDQVAQRYGLSQPTGALVTAVQRGSVAEAAGVDRGDVIVKIDNQPVTSAAQAGEILSKADLSKGVRLFIVNRDGSKFIFLQK